ncbi:hypothetical protein [Aestuariibaculum suncheonense]|uniref:Uncharacterized protein n=1 Tax=Aestuariibaculum suncheonense TaxID=1028745 RepID=A0A8J6Q6H1_9FLAO|nr:hypothetical protein [Aestuariibaculum suncheonense]MBD0835237.1 hypothetical protein [Aestuariibaculum suncheonense]
MKLFIALILILTNCSLFSQGVNEEVLNEIYQRGKTYTTPIKNGQIESLRNVNPPKDTWIFSKLEEYKKNLGSKDILYGSILMPSSVTNSNLYSYNLFAFDVKKKTYCFVAIVSYKVIGKDVKFSNSYLFTEKPSLKDWWTKIFGFYHSQMKDDIPQKFLFKTCPPPPFRE